MAAPTKPNYDELIEYFDALGFDANCIPEESVNETGFLYWPENIRAGSDGRVANARVVTWPSPEVLEDVRTLMAGGTLKIVDKEPVKAKEKKVEKK